MTSFLDNFLDMMTQTASVYSKTAVYDDTTGDSSYTWGLLETIKNVAFYEGSAAERFVNERFRAEIAGVIIADPKKVTNTIQDDYRIDIGSRSFCVIHSEDVMLRDEVLVIPVKEWTGDVS